MSQKVAVVTGAAGGIGKGISAALAGDGMHVALLDVRLEAVHEVAASIRASGGVAEPFAASVAIPEQVEAAVEAVLERFEVIDILVNNAGVAHVGTVADTSVADWDRVIGVNLTGVFLVSRSVIPQMVSREGGSIVNVASAAGLRGAAGMAAYTASKAGIVGLTRQMAKDFGPSGIRVNCVCPGTVPTPMHDVFYTPDEAEETLAEWGKRRPISRNGSPEDVAEAISFLVSDASSFITGAVVPIDGGATL